MDLTKLHNAVVGAGDEGWLAGSGEMDDLILSTDWSRTPLGPTESWSPTLRMMTRFLLANRFPLLLWWGPDYISIYNDAYRPILGTKHPRALGQPVRECWSEIWDVLQPLIDTPFQGGPATWDEDILLEIDRYGFLEEAHFTIAYSPVPDDDAPSGIGGVLATVHEISEQVIGDRRAIVLRDLGAHIADARTVPEACAVVTHALSSHARDVPFALIYLLDEGGSSAYLASAAGVEMGQDISPLRVELRDQPADGWPLATALRRQADQPVTRLNERFTEIPAGPWNSPPDTAVVMPISPYADRPPSALLVAGVSSRLKLDEHYRAFLDLVCTIVATAIANAQAYETERRRAEELAALDRAKTTFFSNVSHEFRTPLTLLLGPLEDLLAGDDALSPDARERLSMAHRNALRLLKLVNTLLDFSRIEAGRIQATYERTNLPRLVTDLASQFRSAIERAGLCLLVDCPSLPESTAIYVDREMWEKIVLNLLSNAFKFTFDGEISVTLRAADDGRSVNMAVRDSGIGIPAEEIPHLFERFRRVQGARSRTHEGTGIGLALVQDLVKLHGGTVTVESEIDRGTTFTVTIPTGSGHLPAERVVAERTLTSTALGAAPFVEEALRWLPVGENPAESASHGADERTGEPILLDSQVGDGIGRAGRTARILVADDNADMRAYLKQLLSPFYEVEAVADGTIALAAALERTPDLIVSDVMMPGLSGFELLRELRAQPRTREVPVVLLSARAGEEAKLEGLQAGADDYLTKPFSARELLARVRAYVELARVRAEAIEGERTARQEADEARYVAELATRAHDVFLTETAHDLRSPLTVIKGRAELLRRQAAGAGLAGDSRLLGGLKGIEDSVERIQSQIDDLLDIARLRSGQQLELRCQTMDLVALAREIVAQEQQASERHQIQLITELSALTGIWDLSRLRRMLSELVRNAIKYSPDGGLVSLAVSREQFLSDESAVVRVEDQGVGIPPGDLAGVFERFQRAGNIGQISGSGIGLASVRQIVEQHGGSISVESRVGAGSTFSVRLPLRSGVGALDPS